MTHPNDKSNRSEQEMLQSAVDGLNADGRDEKGNEKFAEEAAIRKAKADLEAAQKKPDRSHSWNDHFSALGRG